MSNRIKFLIYVTNPRFSRDSYNMLSPGFRHRYMTLHAVDIMITEVSKSYLRFVYIRILIWWNKT